MAALRLAGVAKRFGGTTVLDGVDLAVPAGSLTAILGRSGSGKTTLLRIVCGFATPDAGEVLLDGAPVPPRPEHRRVGYVPQEGALFPHLTVAGNVLFGLGRAARRTPGAADRWLELVGLPTGYARRYPHELSGGEQGRVALARALAPAPRLVLLDEPFSALDATLRGETRGAVARALREAGATAILVTHDQAEALSMGDQVAVLRRGRMVQVAAPDALYRRPADLELARFVGDATVLPGEARGGARAVSPLGELALAVPVPTDGPVQLMLRPEQLVLGAAGAPAQVTEAVFTGPEVRLSLRLDGTGVHLLARAPGHLAPPVGARVHLAVSGPVVAYPAAG